MLGDKPTHDIWVKGWLKEKEYCGNPRHNLFNPFIDNIILDLKNGQNRILLVVGTMRSGKSYFSLWYMCFMNWCYFGRDEYKPDSDNIEPMKDIYWDLDDFVEATKNPDNRDKFIMLEEQGLAQYKNDWFKTDVTNYDKITQIFGVDNTNLILNLPYIFDLFKGTRLKANYLFRAIRVSKTRIDVIMFPKRMGLTTEKAYFSTKERVRWYKFPNVKEIYPSLVDEYEKAKLLFNSRMKDKFSRKDKSMINKALGI
jgi:hypothetical protein